jgi:hypothetical protein
LTSPGSEKVGTKTPTCPPMIWLPGAITMAVAAWTAKSPQRLPFMGTSVSGMGVPVQTSTKSEFKAQGPGIVAVASSEKHKTRHPAIKEAAPWLENTIGREEYEAIAK